MMRLAFGASVVEQALFAVCGTRQASFGDFIEEKAVFAEVANASGAVKAAVASLLSTVG